MNFKLLRLKVINFLKGFIADMSPANFSLLTYNLVAFSIFILVLTTKNSKIKILEIYFDYLSEYPKVAVVETIAENNSDPKCDYALMISESKYVPVNRIITVIQEKLIITLTQEKLKEKKQFCKSLLEYVPLNQKNWNHRNLTQALFFLPLTNSSEFLLDIKYYIRNIKNENVKIRNINDSEIQYLGSSLYVLYEFCNNNQE